MAYLAMHALGLGDDRIEHLAGRYSQRLVAIVPSPEAVTESTWIDHIGPQSSYAALRQFFGAQIEKQGWQATVTRFLPPLISGWIGDAFHATIRLGYGIEFQVPTEIASGLAYLAMMGNDPQLEAAARREPSTADANFYLTALRTLRDDRFSVGSFDDRVRLATHESGLCPCAGASEEVLRALSRSCLEVFAATREFFALHLVTGSHAFRVCSPYAGPDWGQIYSVGIAVAYLAVGAPDFVPVRGGKAELPMEMLLGDTDEHDLKLAYTSLQQSEAFDDPTYRAVVARYLALASR
jgi:hypothetical protein